MPHPVIAHRLQEAGGPPAPPARTTVRSRSEPRLWPLLLPILILGGLAMAHVWCLARLSMLDCESHRLERLILEQTSRTAELARQRDQLTNPTLLAEYAARKGLVPAAEAQPVKVGVLPPARVYWSLDEHHGRGRYASRPPATPAPGSPTDSLQ